MIGIHPAARLEAGRRRLACRPWSVVLAVVLVLAVSPTLTPVSCGAANVSRWAPGLLSSNAVARAVMKYFGREGVEEGTEYMVRQGGKEIAERVGNAAIRQGGQEAADQVAALTSKYGPQALEALDNVPDLAPVLSALDELPESQVRSALARLSAGSAGRELAESVGKVGSAALRSELKHPGIGGTLARALGDDGVELASKLNADQALLVTSYADELAKLPVSQRQGVLALLRSDTERMVGFLGRFAADNPGKVLFTAATTTVILAESDRILGGDEIVFDAEGNPIVVSKAGLMGRTLESGGKALGHVSANYLQPLYLAVIAFVVTFATLFMAIKLWHLHQREKLTTAAALENPPSTVEGKIARRDESDAIRAEVRPRN